MPIQERTLGERGSAPRRKDVLPAGKCSLLVASARPDLLAGVEELAGANFAVTTADGPGAALAALAGGPFDLLLADQALRPLNGIGLLGWARRHARRTARVLLTDPVDAGAAAEAVCRGDVFGYATVPLRADGLLATLDGAVRQVRRQRQSAPLMRHWHGERAKRRLRQAALLERLVGAPTREVTELEEEGRKLRRRSAELERLALTDPLTDLANRRAIEADVEHEIRRRGRQPGPLAVGLIDADHFKTINTEHHHPGGDHALIGLARALVGALRTTDRVGRLGGEEFLVVAPQTDVDGAAALAERIRAAVERTPVYYNGQAIRLTVSVGFAVAGRSERADFKGLLGIAAAALATAKAAGRNRAVVSEVRG